MNTNTRLAESCNQVVFNLCEKLLLVLRDSYPVHDHFNFPFPINTGWKVYPDQL
jgi:hypothetical protein